MFQPLEVFIGLRYVRAKRRNHFISFISFSSMLGTALGVWALITILSVMNGFEKELRDRILSMAAHVTIESTGSGLSNWQEVAASLGHQAQVTGAAPYIEGQAMLNHEEYNQGILLRGILPSEEPKVSQVIDKMIAGTPSDLVAKEYRIILGAELAAALRVDLGEHVRVVIPQATVTPAGLLPRYKRFTVVGIFELGIHEYDSAVALVHIDDAARLYRMQDEVTGVRLRLTDLFLAPKLIPEFKKVIGEDYNIEDWTQRHASLFSAITMEKRVMFVILFLIVAVAAFNIVSTLVMVVTDKQSDIAILRTMGLHPRSVMGVFIIQGSVIGIVGVMIGIIFGIPTALHVGPIVNTLERWFNVQFLSPDIYYINELVSDLHWEEVVLIAVSSLILTVCATLYPAWRAGCTQPADALRYE